jgi:hypothetical protein
VRENLGMAEATEQQEFFAELERRIAAVYRREPRLPDRRRDLGG